VGFYLRYSPDAPLSHPMEQPIMIHVHHLNGIRLIDILTHRYTFIGVVHHISLLRTQMIEVQDYYLPSLIASN